MSNRCVVCCSPGAAMDGAWRGCYDFAVFVGDCGRDKDVDNSSMILDMLFSLGLRVNFFNFKDHIRVLGPQLRKDRVMYLCCCYDDCALAYHCSPAFGCAVVGVTKEVGFHTQATRDHMKKYMVQLPTMLVIMIPCTGGSNWQHVNSASELGRKIIKEHRKLFAKLWASVVKLLPHIVKHKSAVIIEWPDTCAYWKLGASLPCSTIMVLSFALLTGACLDCALTSVRAYSARGGYLLT